MKFLKYIILVVLLIIITLIILLLNVLKGDPHLYQSELNEPYVEIEPNKIVSDVSIKDNYYDVKDIIEKYYSYLTDLNKTEEDIVTYPSDDVDGENIANSGEQAEGNNMSLSEMLQEEKNITKTAIYSRLNQEFIEKNGITVDNIQENLETTKT